jgi:hypothetical protein
MKRIVIGALAVAALAATGAPGQASRDRTTLLATVSVSMTDSKIVLNKKTAGRGLVIFKVLNAGAKKHNFAISGRHTRDLSHGQSETLRVTFLRKGHYSYSSTVTGDAAAGLKGVFTIT